MKRLWAFLVLFGLLAGFVAWAGGGGEVAKPAVTISLWGWRTQDEPVWKKVQELLQARGENIIIDFQALVATEYDAKLLLALQGGTGPDIYLTRRLPNITRMQPLIDGKFLEPIDGLVDLKNFTPVTLSFIQQGGKTYGVPFANQVVGIFYNLDIFAKYNLKEPQTADELLAICKTLQANKVTPFFMPGKDAWILAMQHAMTGVSIPGEEWIGRAIRGEAKFTDAPFVDLNKKLYDLRVYYQKDFMANAGTDMDAAFATEQAAMVFYGVWGDSNWLKLNPNFKYGYFPVPGVKAADTRVYVYMDGSYGLNPASKNRDAALKLLNFTATTEFGKLFSELTGEMTAMKDVELPKNKPVLAECYAIANTMAAKYIYWVGSPFEAGNPTVYNILTPGMQELYLGQTTPEGLAKKVQDGVATWYPAFKK
jgi:raffinose/stachyose/melibiose transport system substrate-binding protein